MNGKRVAIPRLYAVSLLSGVLVLLSSMSALAQLNFTDWTNCVQGIGPHGNDNPCTLANGVWPVTSTINVTRSGLTVQGQSQNYTILERDSVSMFTGSLLAFNNVSGIWLTALTIDGNRSAFPSQVASATGANTGGPCWTYNGQQGPGYCVGSWSGTQQVPIAAEVSIDNVNCPFPNPPNNPCLTISSLTARESPNISFAVYANTSGIYFSALTGQHNAETTIWMGSSGNCLPSSSNDLIWYSTFTNDGTGGVNINVAQNVEVSHNTFDNTHSDFWYRVGGRQTFFPECANNINVHDNTIKNGYYGNNSGVYTDPVSGQPLVVSGVDSGGTNITYTDNNILYNSSAGMFVWGQSNNINITQTSSTIGIIANNTSNLNYPGIWLLNNNNNGGISNVTIKGAYVNQRPQVVAVQLDNWTPSDMVFSNISVPPNGFSNCFADNATNGNLGGGVNFGTNPYTFHVVTCSGCTIGTDQTNGISPPCPGT